MSDIDAYDVRARVKDPEHLWVSVLGGFAIAAVLVGVVELLIQLG